ncbi:uncharacterized protein Z518_01687 [Rhinocladiella mackenziei CBS 650.93]|uniref:Mitochondrial import inner membrane translocase subunit TIM50 n=1 Tax=Rhinocladiella mackenziei CBS 650.93 TaxID=1442369 RepID=A0A0D2HIW7_9EURO|nr:uncharacterized protein Z518_01687 [Rhinocladiella mackenziei CBS 650.93]KIX10603.1 hypothetical protein Z518_01687 [Rhinocladiella mackenziei CBS 650.93]
MARAKQAARIPRGGPAEAGGPGGNEPPQNNQGMTIAGHCISDQPSQPQQGDYYEYLDRNRINIYKAVDSWRSYKNDSVNLQMTTGIQACSPATVLTIGKGQPQQGYQPQVQGLNANVRQFQTSHSQFAANQFPRSVHNFARYSTYRVDKSYRVSDGPRKRRIVQQAPNSSQMAPHPPGPRYNLRQRRPDQIAPYSAPASPDAALPSTEAPRVPTGSVQIPNLPIHHARGRRFRSATPREVASPPPPEASPDYKRKAELPTACRESPQKLLVILDLNGTLLVRPNGRTDPKMFKIRPGVRQLLDYLFENHVVMVYSSTRPENATGMVNNLIHPTQRAKMAAVWGRDKLDLSQEQYYNKVQVYKNLLKIWRDKSIQSKAEPGRKWDQSNTVLVDDCRLKALAQPHNLLQVPEFENNAPRQGGQALREWQLQQMEIVKSLEQKLEELKWQVDVSRLIREWQTGKRQAPGVVDETVDQKTQKSLQQQQQEPSPAPSGGQPSEPQNFSTSRSPPRFETDPPEYEQTDGTIDEQSNTSLLDKLQISLRKTTTKDIRRSESPIDESVWSEIVTGGKAENQKQEGKGKTSQGDNLPTPESMGA